MKFLDMEPGQILKSSRMYIYCLAHKQLVIVPKLEEVVFLNGNEEFEECSKEELLEAIKTFFKDSNSPTVQFLLDVLFNKNKITDLYESQDATFKSTVIDTTTWIYNNHPTAYDLEVGSNGYTQGIWFKLHDGDKFFKQFL